MALTNFGLLTDEQLTVWSRDTWRAARNNQFLNRFVGDGPDAMIQRITELKKDKKGARAVITLVADLEGDGIAGDRTLEGNEEAMSSADQVIRLDQLRHGVAHEGKMADQKSVVEFRNNAKNALGYWLPERLDQMGFLTLSGVTYEQQTNGKARVGSDLPYLEFAADVTAPSANRYLVWDSTGFGVNTSNTQLATADTPTWKMLLEAKAYAKDNFMKPIRGEEGMELYNVFMTPQGIAKLKQDSDFKQAWQNAMPRSKDNPLFKGTDVIYIDGLAIYEFRHVYNTKGKAGGSKWGIGGAVDGQRVLMCGAQAMGFADIGDAEWNEKGFDYDNRQGIKVGKIIGYKKPVFPSMVTGTDEDFSVLCIDTAI